VGLSRRNREAYKLHSAAPLKGIVAMELKIAQFGPSIHEHGSASKRPGRRARPNTVVSLARTFRGGLREVSVRPTNAGAASRVHRRRAPRRGLVGTGKQGAHLKQSACLQPMRTVNFVRLTKKHLVPQCHGAHHHKAEATWLVP